MSVFMSCSLTQLYTLCTQLWIVNVLACWSQVELLEPWVLSCVWSGESWTELERLGEKWWKSLIISDNQTEICLIITINDTSIGDLPLIITISDTCKNQSKRIDSDNTFNLSRLIVILVEKYTPWLTIVSLTHTCHCHWHPPAYRSWVVHLYDLIPCPSLPTINNCW